MTHGKDGPNCLFVGGPIHETMRVSERTGRTAEGIEAMTQNRGTWGAAVLLAIHAAMSGPLLDREGDNAEDTDEMEALWVEVWNRCPTMDDFHAAWNLSVKVFG